MITECNHDPMFKICDKCSLLNKIELLEDQRDKEFAALKVKADGWESIAVKLQHQINMLINFIPEGWAMPLGYSELVEEIKGE